MFLGSQSWFDIRMILFQNQVLREKKPKLKLFIQPLKKTFSFSRKYKKFRLVEENESGKPKDIYSQVLQFFLQMFFHELQAKNVAIPSDGGFEEMRTLLKKNFIEH